MRWCWGLWLWLFLGLAVEAQNASHFGFSRSLAPRFLTRQGDSLPLALAGGMNAVRFSEIDLNGDGVKDLFAFEKHGDRVLTFIKHIDNDVVTYRYAPEYKHFFPDLQEWVILKDYDHDGKEDIFTYGNAGIRVFRNTSAEVPGFDLVTDQLTAVYPGGTANIYCSPDDYMAIEDVDGDGDLDILNFMVLGKYVHELRNYAAEHAGVNGELDFYLESECWGHFAEGAEDNAIALEVDCNQDASRDRPRHVGSTILLTDFNRDSLPDVVIGDVDYPGLLLLENGGTLEEARMISQSADFPTAAAPVSLYSMPVVSLVDADGDGRQEMAVSPSDPSLVKSQDLNSVWLYRYDTLLQDYVLQTHSFLQDQMVDVGSGCYPIVYDWNGDGLTDIFLANFGSYDSSVLHNRILSSFYSSSLTYYQNVGTEQNSVFQCVTNDFGALKQYGLQALYPVFADFDGDGTTDLLAGNKEGNLLFFANLSHDTLPVFSAPEIYGDVTVGAYSTPQLFDLNRDGKKDLVVGNRRGQLAYYQNVANSEGYDFQLVTTALGGVDVRDADLSYFGYAVPCFFENEEGKIFLFCINEQGKIACYKNIENNLEGNFDLETAELFETSAGTHAIAEGVRGGVAVADFNRDGLPDLWVGNYAGGLSYFKGITPQEVNIVDNQQYMKDAEVKIFPNPARHYVTISVEGNPLVHKTMRIFDFQGKQVLSRCFSGNSITVETDAWRAGGYFVQILEDVSRGWHGKFLLIP